MRISDSKSEENKALFRGQEKDGSKYRSNFLTRQVLLFGSYFQVTEILQIALVIIALILVFALCSLLVTLVF